MTFRNINISTNSAAILSSPDNSFERPSEILSLVPSRETYMFSRDLSENVHIYLMLSFALEKRNGRCKTGLSAETNEKISDRNTFSRNSQNSIVVLQLNKLECIFIYL